MRALEAIVVAPLLLVARSMRGRHRHAWIPIWFAGGIALASLWWLPASLILLAAGLVVGRVAPRLGGAAASEREWRLASTALFVGALWMVATVPPQRMLPDYYDGRRTLLLAQWGLFAVLFVTLTAAWLAGRRIRKRPEQEVPQLVTDWRKVREELPELAGTWDLATYDEQANSAVIELHSLRADVAAKKSEEVERILNVRPGGIMMRHKEGSPVRHLIVQYLPDPVGRHKRIDYASDVVVEDERRIFLGVTSDEAAVWLTIYRPGGVCHVVITGAQGSGKGACLHLLIVALIRNANSYVMALDCKGGNGIPAIRDGVDIYAENKDQWRAAFRIVVEISEARKRRYGTVLKVSSWSPKDDPDINFVVDESFRLKQWMTRTEWADLQTLAAQVRSLGIRMILASQRGDGDSLGGTDVRNNLLGNGTALMHRPGDSIARQMASQDFKIAANKLPRVAGWAYPLSGVDDDAAEVAIRMRYLPTTKEVEDGLPDGLAEPPYGVVEDWMDGAVHPRLHPEDQAIVDRYWPVDAGPNNVIDISSLPRPREEGEGGLRARVAPAPEGEPPLPPEEEATRRDQIRQHLASCHPGWAKRGQIATSIDCTPEYVSELLRKLKRDGEVEQNNNEWRLLQWDDATRS